MLHDLLTHIHRCLQHVFFGKWEIRRKLQLHCYPRKRLWHLLVRASHELAAFGIRKPARARFRSWFVAMGASAKLVCTIDHFSAICGVFGPLPSVARHDGPGQDVTRFRLFWVALRLFFSSSTGLNNRLRWRRNRCGTKRLVEFCISRSMSALDLSTAFESLTFESCLDTEMTK